MLSPVDEASPVCELRIANDGCAYNLSEFQRWYPADWLKRWQEANVLPVTLKMPKGLWVDQVDQPLVKAVWEEIMPYFPEDRCQRRHRSALELGWTYEGADAADPVRKALPLDRFPQVRELVAQAMRKLSPSTPSCEERLNVSCLLYSPGHCIPWHCDRPYVYTNEVFGCVLFNNSDSGLQFLTEKGRKLVHRYVLPEESGSCFMQEGDARYHWKHGVPTLNRGERLSVTWRWFLDDIILNSK